ncbi:putative nicotinamide mononucleotide adenylyltransferase [Ceratocystis lukuohia]|uniref:Nicotinamide mononucleotide adenylyltransferase n=1 Tax=Ceratocystis lukuohia TaxID=2019550 RepID=A0ABR4MSI0_9PEZI
MKSRLEAFATLLSKFQTSGNQLCIIKSLGAPWLSTPKQRIIVLDSSFNPPTLAHMHMALTAIQRFSSCSGPTLAVDSTCQVFGESDDTPKAMGVLLLLSVNNADKAPKPAPFAQRLCMMQDFAEDLLEFIKTKPKPETLPIGAALPYSVAIGLTTLPFFHSKAIALAELENGPDVSSLGETLATSAPASVDQCYLVGFDTLVRIFNPKYYGGAAGMREALGPFFARARLSITMRLGSEWGSIADQQKYLEEMKKGGLENVGGCSEWLDRVELVEGRRPGEPVVSSTLVREAVRNGDERLLDVLVSERVKAWIKSEGLYKDN